jgi:DnaJ-class molecular chaperone
MKRDEAETVLGLNQTRYGPDDVRAAYKRRAKTAHPDKGGDDETFRRLKEAHDLLLHDVEEPMMNDITRGLGRLFETFVRAKAQKPLNIDLSIDVTLREVYAGGTKKLNVRTYAGGAPCNKSFLMNMFDIRSRHVFRGGGDSNEYGIVGDLTAELKITDMAPFYFDPSIDNRDLHLDRTCSLFEYMVGAKLDVVLPNGDTVSIATEPLFGKGGGDTTTCVVVHDRGLALDAEGNRGDLIVRIGVSVVPRAGATFLEDAAFVEKLQTYFAS